MKTLLYIVKNDIISEMTHERFRYAREFGLPHTNEWSLEVEPIDRLFERSDAQRWIDLYGFYDHGVLDIESTARNVGRSLMLREILWVSIRMICYSSV